MGVGRNSHWDPDKEWPLVREWVPQDVVCSDTQAPLDTSLS